MTWEEVSGRWRLLPLEYDNAIIIFESRSWVLFHGISNRNGSVFLKKKFVYDNESRIYSFSAHHFIHNKPLKSFTLN